MTIEEEHKKQFQFIKDNNIQIGTKLKLNDNSIEEVKHIHSMYGWITNQNRMISLNEIKQVLEE